MSFLSPRGAINDYYAAFQINARTELALRYNDISPLENHHCAVAFEILEKVTYCTHSFSLKLHGHIKVYLYRLDSLYYLVHKLSVEYLLANVKGFSIRHMKMRVIVV